MQLKENWIYEVKIIQSQEKGRPFTIGHHSMSNFQLPARDANFTGGIKRSNRWPNCSFLTNWTSEDDQIYWDVEVMQEGVFEVEMYYACSKTNLGSTINLTFEQNSTSAKITVANDPLLEGDKNDRFPRMESYVKDFKPAYLGQIKLKKGKGRLYLKSSDIAGDQVADFRLLMLKRTD
jgi:hypothetical protein